MSVWCPSRSKIRGQILSATVALLHRFAGQDQSYPLRLFSGPKDCNLRLTWPLAVGIRIAPASSISSTSRVSNRSATRRKTNISEVAPAGGQYPRAFKMALALLALVIA